jgi:hypothetical protein
MSAKDQGRRFDRDHRNGRFRRILPLASLSNEGPLSESTTAVRRGQQDRKPPEGQLKGSEGDEGGQSFGVAREILGELPVAPKRPTSLFAITASPIAGASCHPTRR